MSKEFTAAMLTRVILQGLQHYLTDQTSYLCPTFGLGHDVCVTTEEGEQEIDLTIGGRVFCIQVSEE